MQYINEIAIQYQGLISLISGLFGLVGFAFGVWRYFRECSARKAQEEIGRERDNALSRLKHLENLAAGLKQYSAAL